MKKVVLVALLCAGGLMVNAQSKGSFNSDAASINGCTDARSGSGNWNRYNQIMANGSISRQYKEAYDLGFKRCLSSSNWQVKNGKLVNISKDDGPDRRPPNGRGIEVWITKVLIYNE